MLTGSSPCKLLPAQTPLRWKAGGPRGDLTLPLSPERFYLLNVMGIINFYVPIH